MTLTSKYGLNIIRIILAIILFLLLILSCSCSRTKEANVSMFVSKIGHGYIEFNSSHGGNYKSWSVEFAKMLRQHAYFYCSLDDGLVVGFASEKDVNSILPFLKKGYKVSGKHETASSSDPFCNHDGDRNVDIRKIKFNKQLKGVDTQAIDKGSVYLHPEVYMGTDAGKEGYSSAIKFGYPRGLPIEDQDFSLKLSLIKERYGDDCCSVAPNK